MKYLHCSRPPCRDPPACEEQLKMCIRHCSMHGRNLECQIDGKCGKFVETARQSMGIEKIKLVYDCVQSAACVCSIIRTD